MRPTAHPAAMAVFVALLLASAGAFAWLIYPRVALLTKLQPSARLDRWGERWRGVLRYFIGQKRILDPKYLGAGLMHAFIFWGFLAVGLNTVHFVGAGFVQGFHLPGFGPGSWLGEGYVAVRDAFEIAVVAMVSVAAYRRAVVKPKRLTLSWDAALILSLIGTLMITDLWIAGVETAATGTDRGYNSFGGALLAPAIGRLGEGVRETGFLVAWWAHLVALLFFFAYLPISKHFHVVTSFPSILFRRLDTGALPSMDLENSETFGVVGFEDLRWKDVLDVYSCTECGRCQDACPAFATGKPLNPKKINEDMRDALMPALPVLLRGAGAEGDGDSERATPVLPSETIADDVLWSCTTCRACEQACPLFIEFIDRIVGMRRKLVLEDSSFPTELTGAYKNLEKNANPWGIDPSEREAWAEGLDVPRMADATDVEYVVWIGCAGAFDDRSKKVARATARVLNSAGVRFAILGAEEACTGDPARRSGNEYLFQMLAEQNVETLNGYGVKKIVTQCPHCFNTLLNEYPEFGGKYEVLHHTELIARLVKDGRVPLRQDATELPSVTFHDSCYLGRHNGQYDAPRAALEAIPGLQLKEMPRCREKGFCCGAGGGRMWMEESIGTKVNQNRVDEAAETGAGVVAASCPFCITMLSDGINETGRQESMEVLDVAQIVEGHLAPTSADDVDDPT